jgi:hypothetical protein
MAFWLLLLAAIAWFMAPGRQPARVTVSGLTLEVDRDQVLKLKGQPNFLSGPADRPDHLEYWSDPVNLHPSLSLDFTPDGQLKRMEGGCPEIDGENVRLWSLAQVEQALGSAEFASRSSALSNGGAVVGGDAYLKYPDRRLLVTWDPEKGINFILFRGSR